MWDVKVGDQVVCIDSKISPDRAQWAVEKETYPVEGVTYTVRCVDSTPRGLAIRLNEIHNPLLPYTGGTAEMSLRLNRFRPVQKKHTGMETLTSILLKPSQKINGFEQTKVKKTVKA